MFRSVVVIALFLIFPSFSSTQEVVQVQQTTHEVVKGETLWTLANRYYGNPYRWPLLYEANAADIQNPNILEPGQVLIIPAVGTSEPQVEAAARVQGVTVVTREIGEVTQVEPSTLPGLRRVQAAREPPATCPGPGDRTVFFPDGQLLRGCVVTPPAAEQRSAFFPESTATPDLQGAPALGSASAGMAPEAVSSEAVPMGLTYGAEWLEGRGVDASFLGMLEEYAHIRDDRTEGGPGRIGERITISGEEGARFRVGDLLQSYRTLREDRKLGVVQIPTGILVVTEVTEGGAVATVSLELDRVWLGDWVRTAPPYTALPGVFPVPVESHVTATILGFAQDRPVQGFGARAFLDVGMDEGIDVGDVFRAYIDEPGPGFGMPAARLQVILVDGNRSTARVTGLMHPTLDTGDLLRLIEKMQ